MASFNENAARLEVPFTSYMWLHYLVRGIVHVFLNRIGGFV